MNRASAPGLDRFKLIVSLILGAILLLMVLRGCATGAVPNEISPGMTETSSISDNTETLTALPEFTETISAPSATETLVSSPVPPTEAATSTKTVSLETSTPLPIKSTPTVSPDLTATLAVTKIAATPASGEGSSCNTSAPSRLNAGQRARVILRLNMRSEPSITAPILQTNPANTEVEIIGGPTCTPVGKRAYLWWQIRLPDGAEGWSAEAQLNQPSYFLEPIP